MVGVSMQVHGQNSGVLTSYLDGAVLREVERGDDALRGRHHRNDLRLAATAERQVDVHDLFAEGGVQDGDEVVTQAHHVREAQRCERRKGERLLRLVAGGVDT